MSLLTNCEGALKVRFFPPFSLGQYLALLAILLYATFLNVA